MINKREGRDEGDGLKDKATAGCATPRRKRAVCPALVLAACGYLLVTSSALAATNFTWSGGAPAGKANWSEMANWEGGVSPSGAVGTLSFPKLPSACEAQPPADACYLSENNLSGVTAEGISLDDARGYSINGNGITLGKGGLTASSSATKPGASVIFAPITLSEQQTWSINGNDGDINFEGRVTGSNALAIDLENGGGIFILGGTAKGSIEAGPVTITGEGMDYVGLEGSSLNGAIGGNPVKVIDTTINFFGGRASSIGPLTLGGGELGVGGELGTLAVDGGLSLSSTTSFGSTISKEGSVAGTDYSQVSASGAVNIANAHFFLDDEAFPEGGGTGKCATLRTGDVATILTTTASVEGTFSGVPNGTVVKAQCSPGTPQKARISYTEHTVTATIEPGGKPTTTTLSAAPEHPVANQTVTLTATVSAKEGGTPLGAVSFANHGVLIPGCERRSLSLSTATCETTFSAASSPEALTATFTPEFGSELEGSTSPVDNLSVGGGEGGSTSGSSASIAGVPGPIGGVPGPMGGVLGTQASASPAPVLGQRETAGLVSGTVTIRLPNTTRFVVLSGETSIPNGAEVDATNGRVLITAKTLSGKTVSAEVYGGRFRIHQDPDGETHFILSLALTGCPRVTLPRGSAAAFASASKRRSGPKTRHLWASETGGSWGTNGRFVSTSVEGTAWLTLDECKRSEVKVTKGKVKVHDLVLNKTKTVSAGGHYIASAKR